MFNFFKKKAKIPAVMSLFSDIKNVSVASDFSIGQYKSILIIPGARLTIEEYVSMREFCNILVYEKGNLTIKKNVFFNNYCSINCLEKIEIGENTLFGEGVKIYDHNHQYQFSNAGLKVERNSFKTAPVKIGDNCWVGSNVTILKGVEIGNNVVIGAGNLIYKSIPSNSIVV
jgi:acetyltransferase-like isoleucine patch superfamily enzyme